MVERKKKCRAVVFSRVHAGLLRVPQNFGVEVVYLRGVYVHHKMRKPGGNILCLPVNLVELQLLFLQLLLSTACSYGALGRQGCSVRGRAVSGGDAAHGGSGRAGICSAPLGTCPLPAAGLSVLLCGPQCPGSCTSHTGWTGPQHPSRYHRLHGGTCNTP